MCGIVAATAARDVVPVLIAGLKALEYRGYDSAGISVLENGRLARVRAAGKEGAAGNDGVAEKLAAVDKARQYLERFITEDRVFRDLFFALAG